MKISLSFKVRSLVLAAALVAGLGIATHATARQDSYLIDLGSRTVTQLGNLGGDFTAANAINDAGQVVGNAATSTGHGRAFITGSDGVGMRDLGTLGGNYVYVEASGINNAGQVVGYSSTSDTPHAFITGPNGTGMRDLGRLDGDSSYATGINDAGQVVGFFYPTLSTQRAFITGPNGADPADLNSMFDLPNGVVLYNAVAINNAAVRWQGSPQCPAPPCMRSSPGPSGAGLRDLGTFRRQLLQYRCWHQRCRAGCGTVNHGMPGAWHAFITGTNGVGMSDLGALAMDYSVARGINDAGQIVGMAYMEWRCPCFHHRPRWRGMMDLNSLVELPRGIVLTEAGASITWVKSSPWVFPSPNPTRCF